MEIPKEVLNDLKSIINIEKENNLLIHKIDHNFYTKKENKIKKAKGTTEYIITDMNEKFEPIFVKVSK